MLAAALVIGGCGRGERIPAEPPAVAEAARPSDAKKEDWSLYSSAKNAQDELIVDKDALAAAHTDWPLVTAQLLELRRRGNTLHVKLALRNGGVEMQRPMFIFSDVRIVDPNTGVRYGVTMDNQRYVATTNADRPDRFYDDVDPGETITATMEFTAPPADVKVVDLEIPNVRPLTSLRIQDE
jgi:hypothetical protein